MRLEGDESLRIHTELTFKWIHSKALREHSSMGLYIVRTYKHNATGGNQADCGQQLRSEGKSSQVVIGNKFEMEVVCYIEENKKLQMGLFPLVRY